MAGGAWKVAYADLVTAMFALFLVLWIIGQDEEILGLQSRDFQDPWQTVTRKSTSVIQVPEVTISSSREGNFVGETLVPYNHHRTPEKDVMKTFMYSKELMDNRNCLIKKVKEGILISFFDNPSEKESMFKDKLDAKGNPILTDKGLTALRSVGLLIARYSRNGRNGSSIEVNSHTEKGRFDEPWEMSAKQAIVVVNKLIETGIKREQVVKISGMGDSTPVEVDGVPIKSTLKQNRRYEILIRTKPETL